MVRNMFRRRRRSRRRQMPIRAQSARQSFSNNRPPSWLRHGRAVTDRLGQLRWTLWKRLLVHLAGESRLAARRNGLHPIICCPGGSFTRRRESCEVEVRRLSRRRRRHSGATLQYAVTSGRDHCVTRIRKSWDAIAIQQAAGRVLNNYRPISAGRSGGKETCRKQCGPDRASCSNAT